MPAATTATPGFTVVVPLNAVENASSSCPPSLISEDGEEIKPGSPTDADDVAVIFDDDDDDSPSSAAAELEILVGGGEPSSAAGGDAAGEGVKTRSLAAEPELLPLVGTTVGDPVTVAVGDAVAGTADPAGATVEARAAVGAAVLLGDAVPATGDKDSEGGVANGGNCQLRHPQASALVGRNSLTGYRRRGEEATGNRSKIHRARLCAGVSWPYLEFRPAAVRPKAGWTGPGMVEGDARKDEPTEREG